MMPDERQLAAQNLANIISQTKNRSAQSQALMMQSGQIPDFSQISTNQYQELKPRNPDDQQIFPETPFGIQDPEWDYRTAQQGPDGQPLPQGAVGWTPAGSAWYGTKSNISEWWMGLGNRWNQKSALTSKEAFQMSANKAGEFVDALRTGDLGSVMPLAFQSLASLFQAAGAGEEGGDRTFLQQTSRFIGFGIEGFGMHVGEVADLGERAIGTVQRTAEDIGEQSGLGDVGGSDQEKVRARLEDFIQSVGLEKDGQPNFWGNSARWMQGLGQMVNPVANTWNFVRSASAILGGSVSLEEAKDIAGANWQASRVLYSQWIDPALKAEYTRRFKAGENPYLLAEELQNPIAELVGEAILDPLNVVAFISKANKASKSAKTFEDLNTTANRIVGEALNASADMSDAERLATVTTGTQKWIEEVRSGITSLANQGGFKAATTAAKRQSLTNVAGNFSSWLMQNVGGVKNFRADDTMEAVRALFMMSSKNSDEVLEGVSVLTSNKFALPADVIFSEGAGRTSVVLRDIIEAGGDDFLERMSKMNLDEMMEFADEAIESSSRRMFPTLADQAANPAKYGPLSNTDRVMLGFENALDKLSGVNSFLAHVYMGMSPGYVFRNAITNSMHIFLDADALTGVRSFGSQVGVVFGKSPVSLEKATGFVEDFYGALPRAAKAGIGQAGLEASETLLGKITGWGLRAGQRAEQAASVHAFEAATKQVLRSTWRPGIGIPDVAPLLDAGMDATAARHLQSLMVKSNGKVDDAMKVFRSQMADGSIDMFSSLGWISEADAKLLDDFKVLERFKQGVDEISDRDELVKFVDEMFDDMDSMADEVASDLRGYPRAMDNADVPRHIDEVAFAKDVNFTDDLQATNSAMKTANELADNTNRQLMNEMVMIAQKQGLGPQLDAFIREQPGLGDIASGKYWQDTLNEAAVFNEKAWPPIKDARNFKIEDFDIKAAWQKIGIPGSPPEGMDRLGFAKYAAENYVFPQQRAFWQNFRDIHAAGVDRISGWVLENGFFTSSDNFANLDLSRRALEEARAWDNAIVFGGRAISVDSAAEVDKMRMLANANDIPFDVGRQIDPLEAAEAINETRLAETVFEIPPDTQDILTAVKASDPALLTSEMDPRAAEAITLWATDARSQIQGAQAGTRGTQALDVSDPGFVAATKSSFPAWWGEGNFDTATLGKRITGDKALRGRPAVEEALDMMTRGEDTNAAIFERLREVAIDHAENLPEDFVRALEQQPVSFVEEVLEKPVDFLTSLKEGATTTGDQNFDDLLLLGARNDFLTKQGDFNFKKFLNTINKELREESAQVGERLVIEIDEAKRQKELADLMQSPIIRSSLEKRAAETGQTIEEVALERISKSKRPVSGTAAEAATKEVIQYSRVEDIPFKDAQRLLKNKLGDEFIEQKEILKIDVDLAQKTEDIENLVKNSKIVQQALKEKGIGDFTTDQASNILKSKLGDDFVDVDPQLVDNLPKDTPFQGTPIPPDTGDMAMNTSRYYHNARKEGLLDKMKTTLLEGIEDNWGARKDVFNRGDIEAALTDYGIEANKRSAQMRFVAEQTATEFRNFALIDYADRKNFDTVLSTVFPYHFWYTRTAPNWLSRVVQRPGILAQYQRYKNTLSKLHSDQPEWWRYNINSNELFGLFPDNPLFFNLEATLNPMNGLTGVDFDDKDKVTGWWTRTLQDLGRFGPSTHTLLSLATSYALYQKGEKEAAARWGTQLFPQASSLGAVQSVIQSGLDLGPIVEGGPEVRFEGLAEKDIYGGTGIKPVQTMDPVTSFLSGGLDPYTQRRVGRSLAAMQDEGVITPEQALDAAREQSGQIWDAALERAINQRAVGQLSSFLLGVGFKGRTIQDQQSDEFYKDFYMLMEQRHNLSPSEFRLSMNQLEDLYPFMDTMLTARKGGTERDTGFSYNILGRIPPGSDFLDRVGIDNRLVQLFYDTKGDFTKWEETDRDKFMASIIDLSAVLAIPGNATRDEWDEARNQSGQIAQIQRQIWGSDISDKITNYFALFDLDNGSDLARQYVKIFPEVDAALTYRDEVIISNPKTPLATYYGGIDQIERYYKGLMYTEAGKLFGEDIFMIQSQYFAIDDKNARRAFLKQHPELKLYWNFKDINEELIATRSAGLAQFIPEGTGPSLREGADIGSFGAQDVLAVLQQGLQNE
jgi:hypothetical protein